MDLENGVQKNQVKKESWRTILTLAFQSLGVVYGDLSISPLYVYKLTFAEDILHTESNDEIYGVLSFVFWTLTLVTLLKYVFFVLKADDNGEGGTFALYSLLCRHARVSSLPNCQLADEELSDYKKDTIRVVPKSSIGFRLRSMLEKHRVLQKVLLILALIGTCMVIGDGVLTPALSVFSAVSGVELSMSKEHHKYVEVPVACIILIFLFSLQHFGTHRVGFLFAPIVLAWLLCISIVGVYNIFRWNHHVYQALSPYYMYRFLRKTQVGGWMSLGGILLCITGSEAMFADLGHFSQLSIKIAFTSVVYPALMLAYMGQAAYLSQHHFVEGDYQVGFYVSVPENLRWPVLVLAVLAAVVGSQAIITGTFSIIKQCSALGCFPKVKIVHTSSNMHGQIYIPEINWILMLLCLAVTIGFRDTKRLGNASGLAVITVMLVTTCLMSLVIVLCWHRSVFTAICFVLFFGAIEALFFSASLIKFLEGAWVPIALALTFLVIMYVWHYGTLKKYDFEIQNKVSINWLLHLGPSLGIARVRGIGLIHTELVSGIPAIFSHFVTNLPAFHQVLVFLCIKSVPVPHVRPEERFLVGRIGPKEYRIYRCVVRYGYRDVHKDDMEFENDLVCSIAEFIRSGSVGSDVLKENTSKEDDRMAVIGTHSTHVDGIYMSEENAETVDGPSEHREIIYRDVHKDDMEFENDLVCSIAEFIRSGSVGSDVLKENTSKEDDRMAVIGTHSTHVDGIYMSEENAETVDGPSEHREIISLTPPVVVQRKKKVRFLVPENPKMDTDAREELQELMEARESGIAYIVGNTYMTAKQGSSIAKRFAIDYGYELLRRNSRTATYALSTPNASSLEVGMVYHV